MVKITIKNNFQENALKEVCIVQVENGFVNADINGAANILKKTLYYV